MSPVLTIGHSTRPITEFLDLLQAHGIECIADVRTVPRSRHNPQFNKETLKKALRKAGIGYSHYPGLGGLRRPSQDSVNTGWRNASFRGYADYMQTKDFAESLRELIADAKHRRVALMCAEAVPWRCHRSLIGDALLARGIDVEHIMSGSRRNIHKLTPFARVRGTTIRYPAADLSVPRGKAASKPKKPKQVGPPRKGSGLSTSERGSVNRRA